jgi:hypothetical protein
MVGVEIVLQGTAPVRIAEGREPDFMNIPSIDPFVEPLLTRRTAFTTVR